MRSNGTRIAMGAASVLTLVLLGGAAATARQDNRIEGGWELILTPEGGTPFLNVTTMAAGGGMMAANFDGSAGSGEWRRLSARRFEVTGVIPFQDIATGELRRSNFRSTAILDKSGDAFQGVFTAEIRTQEPLPEGLPLFAFSGTVQGRRIGFCQRRLKI
jgi:hypothetical protein